MLENQRNALRPEPLDFEEFERARRKFQQQLVALLAGLPLDNFADDEREPLPDTRDFGDLARRIAHDIGDALGESFDRGGAIPIAANPEPVLARNLHEIGGLPEDARNFFVLQKVLAPIVLVRRAITS